MLAATTDGTVLYASDNVLQYLGFNQVIHYVVCKCIHAVAVVLEWSAYHNM